MRERHARIAGAICVLTGMFDMQYPSAARGGLGSERPFAHEHIENLPSAIRRGVVKRELACGSKAAASHYFAVSIDASGNRFVSLHYEDFACINRSVVCRVEGCLHEVYVRTRGGYRIVFSGYADDLTMTNTSGLAGFELTRGVSNTSFRWNGHRFLPSSRSP